MTKYLSLTGLQTLVDNIKDQFARSEHTHNASDINAGTLNESCLPVATNSGLGVVKVGSRLSVSTDGTLSASAPTQVVASASIPTNSDAIIWIKTN